MHAMYPVDFPAITSIDEVDALISKDQPPEDATAWINPFEKRFLSLSPAFRRVLYIKYLYRINPAVDRQFSERRNIHVDAASTPAYLHLKSYEKAFSHISHLNHGCFAGGCVRHFLDLGCSPGGFSNFLMKANRGARGSGITLPDEDARFPMPHDLSAFGSRYRLHHDNIITLVMRSVELDLNPTIRLHESMDESDPDPYDLIVAGAFPTLEGHIPWFLRVQLVLSQLLIILTNLSHGGASVIVINTKPFLWLVDVLGLLRHCFESVTTCKGQKLHAVRTSCYLVCRGFRASEHDLHLYTSRLREVLMALHKMSEESRADGGAVNTLLGVDIGPVYIGDSENLPLVFADSADHLSEMGVDKFALELFEPMWASQAEAIRNGFINVFSRSSPTDSDAGRPIAKDGKDFDEAAESGDSSPSVWRPRRQPGATAGLSTTANEFAPDTPPPSPYVPKWRPPQRRMSTTVDIGRSGNQDWRKPTESKPDSSIAFGPAPTTKAEKYADPFFRKRSQSNADSASKWRRD